MKPAAGLRLMVLLAGLLLLAPLAAAVAAPDAGAEGDGFVALRPAVAPDADMLLIAPGTKTVAPGETFSVDVRIEGDAGVVATDVEIKFDTTYLEGVSVTNAGAFDSYFINNSNLAGGYILFGTGTTGAARTPPIKVATLTFRARQTTGTTQLSWGTFWTNVEGANGSVLGGTSPGTIVIETAGQETDTPTPTRTRTATPSPTPTATPTITSSPSPTPAPTDTATPGPTATLTGSPTVTATPTPTVTATASPTATATLTPIMTDTVTPTATVTQPATPSATPTETATAGPSLRRLYLPLVVR